MTLARVAPCGHIAPIGQRCPQCGTTPAEKAESQRKRSKQSYIEIYGTPRWKKLRLEILRRDRFTCHECGAKATHAAHLEPHDGTGSDPRAWDPRNLRASCATCNSREANQRQHATKEASHASQVETPSRTHRDGRRRQEETPWVI
jgi:5-methylcytosine-specific restriction protein A